MRLRHHHFALSVPDLNEAVEWYQQKLGLSLEQFYEIPEFNVKAAFLELNGFRIELFYVPGSSSMPEYDREPGQALAVQGLKHIGFAVNDVKAAMMELEERGVEFLMPITEFVKGVPVTFFKDLNGVTFELYPMNNENAP